MNSSSSGFYPNYRRLPAEWEQQAALMLSLPHAHGNFGENLPAVEEIFLQTAQACHGQQDLILICYDKAHGQRIEQSLRRRGLEQFTLFVCPSDDAWCRDHGPISVIEDGKLRLLDYCFDGWGKRFSADQDARICRNLHEQGAFGTHPLDSMPASLEGGGIDTDGLGTVLSTWTFLRRSRPGCTDEEISECLFAELGATHLLALKRGSLSGDHTDNHIDLLARHIAPGILVYAACREPQHPDYTELSAMEDDLRELRQSNGHPYRLISLPVPPWNPDCIAPRSYCNFLITNQCVLVPTYNCLNDAEALETLGTCFPEHTLIGIDCEALICHGGALHCIGMPILDAA
ncbi:MAG: agmatine deiminase family protein [Candidatus Eutrophobiaceae bacterium]